MKIHFILFISSLKNENTPAAMFKKTIESTIRPVKGDIIDDPGFDAQFHNGYEVVKVTMNYASNECWVSLAPLAIKLEEISIETYFKKLEANGWQVVSKEDLQK